MSSELALAISIIVPMLYFIVTEVIVYVVSDFPLNYLASNLYEVSKTFTIGAAFTGVNFLSNS